MKTDHITINTHSSIRIESDKILYIDPFKIDNELKDADYIFITHEHYDHFSPEDIKKIIKTKSVIVGPKSMKEQLSLYEGQGFNVVLLDPNEACELDDSIKVNTVKAYNNGRPFHEENRRWVGYVIEIGGIIYYIAGDTDANKDNRNVKCDIVLVPIGGKYTMDYKEAADFVNEIKPKVAIPTHYGSITGDMTDGKNFVKLVDKDIRTEIKL